MYHPVDDEINVGMLGMRVSSGKTTPSKVKATIVFSSSTASASVAIIDCSPLEAQAEHTLTYCLLFC